jgi:hypothetical protein
MPNVMSSGMNPHHGRHTSAYATPFGQSEMSKFASAIPQNRFQPVRVCSGPAWPPARSTAC